MKPVTVSELHAALMHLVAHGVEGGERHAWQMLASVVRTEANDDSALEHAWDAVQERREDPERLRTLAQALVSQTRGRPHLMNLLHMWVAGSRQSAHGKQDQANTISGSSWIGGSAVQARDVHGGIHLHATPTAMGTATRPVPRQLLPVPAHFTDRKHDLEALEELRARQPVGAPLLVVINGPAGVGKTALVSRWLRTVADDYPGGHLYADLRGYAHSGTPARPGEVLGQFLRALGVESVPVDLAEQSALWRSLTADLSIAVMLDNAVSAAQARPLLPSAARSLAVVTSRARLTSLRIDGARVYQLGLLAPTAGVELLTRGIGRERVERETQAAHQVVSLCGGLPLAVCLASARLASRPRQPMRYMVDALAQDQSRLDALNVEGEPVMQSALDESYQILGSEAADMYRRLGLLPVLFFDSRIAASVCTISLGDAERLLDTLVEANLVEDIGPDRYRFHDLVRLHARHCATIEESEPARAEVLRRLLDWYLATTTAAEIRLTPIQFTLPRTYAFPTDIPLPFSDDLGALTWLDDHRLNLMAAVQTAAESRWNETAWQLVDAMWPLFLRLRHYDLWIETHRIGLAAARLAGDKAAERQMLNSGAIGLSSARRIDDAITWYTGSLDAAREEGDKRDEGQARLGLGAAHWETRRIEKATRYLEEAIAVWEEVGYPRGTALARIVLGEIALSTGDSGQAIDLFTHAHRTLVTVDDPYDAARALAFLGYAHARAGESDMGLGELHAALNVFQSAGSVHWQAKVLEMLGQTAQDRSETDAARLHFEHALSLYTPISLHDTRRLQGRLESLISPASPPTDPPS